MEQSSNMISSGFQSLEQVSNGFRHWSNICGSGKVGKTKFLVELKKELAKHNIFLVHLDVDDGRGTNVYSGHSSIKIKRIVAKTKDDPEAYDTFINRCVQLHNKKELDRTVLAIDPFNMLYSLKFEELQRAYSNDNLLKVETKDSKGNNVNGYTILNNWLADQIALYRLIFPHLITVSHFKGEAYNDSDGKLTLYERFDYIGKARDVVHRQVDDHLLFVLVPTLENPFNTMINVTNNRAVNMHLGNRYNEALATVKTTDQLKEYFVNLLKKQLGD